MASATSRASSSVSCMQAIGRLPGQKLEYPLRRRRLAGVVEPERLSLALGAHTRAVDRPDPHKAVSSLRAAAAYLDAKGRRRPTRPSFVKPCIQRAALGQLLHDHDL